MAATLTAIAARVEALSSTRFAMVKLIGSGIGATQKKSLTATGRLMLRYAATAAISGHSGNPFSVGVADARTSSIMKRSVTVPIPISFGAHHARVTPGTSRAHRSDERRAGK